ncbi:MAG: hypothetical protein OYL41_11905 [Acidobacteriota bacterium]|nr:hypothetical protein [Acidobacteriota bacterium]
MSGLRAPWIAALVRIGDHPAAGDLAGRRLHPPAGRFVPFPHGSLPPQAGARSGRTRHARFANWRWPT